MDTLKSSVSLVSLGRAIFPMYPETKRPASAHGIKDATRDPDQILAWFSRPGLVPAVATGKPSGVVVLDVDEQHGGMVWLEKARDRLPETEEYETRSGGRHLVFQWHPGIPTIAINRIGSGVEVRSTGASAIYWPSTGLPRVSDALPAPFPSWLLPPPPKPREPAPARVPDDASLGRLLRFATDAAEGERNRCLFWVGCRLAEQVQHGTLSPAYAVALIEAAGVQAGLPRAEARATAQSAIQGGGA